MIIQTLTDLTFFNILHESYCSLLADVVNNKSVSECTVLGDFKDFVIINVQSDAFFLLLLHSIISLKNHKASLDTS